MEFHIATTICILLTISTCIYSSKLPSLLQNRESSNHVLSNSLNPLSEQQSYTPPPREWIKISLAPPKGLTPAVGTRVELECEAIGSPNPRIQWLKDGSPITEDYDYENSVIANTAIAKIKSRLIINSVLPVHQGIIACFAESGAKSQIASTSLYVISQGNENLTDFLNAELIPTSRASARIVLFNTFLMETIGSNIILPCKTVGKPKPQVYWFDNKQQLIINNQNHRVRILPDGELSFENLLWSDMGTYTCIATNSFSKDSIETFLYPMLNEN